MVECFTIMSNEIKGRLDPYFYRTEFKKLENKLKNSKWEVKELGEIFNFYKGKKNNILEIKNQNSKPYILIENLRGEEINNFTDDKDGLECDEKNILIVWDGQNCGQVGTNLKGFVGSTIVKLELKNYDDVYKNFLFHFLNNNFKNLNSFTTGSAIPHLDTEWIKSFKIPIPPKETQNKIVNLMNKAYSSKKSKEAESKKLLSSIDDYILDELEIKLPELKDEITYVVTSEELKNKRADAYYYQPKFKEIEKAIKNGKYEVKELKNTLKYYKKGIEVGSDAYVDFGIPFIRVADIDDFKIKYETDKKIKPELYEKLKEYQPQKDELLFSKDGSIGFCIVVNENKNSIVSSGVLRLKIKKEFNNFYIKTILSSKFFKILTERESIGSIIKHLTPEVFLNLKIPFPPLQVQNKISQEVKKRIQKTEKLQNEANQELQKAKSEVEKIVLN